MEEGAIANIFTGIMTAILMLVTAASTIETNFWWVRIWDFPRVLIATVAIITLICVLTLTQGTSRMVMTLVLAGVLGWQAYRIFPYTPLAAHEVEFVQLDDSLHEDQCFKVLSFNVLQDNRDYKRTLDMIAREDPDIVLLLETDDAWNDALAPVMDKYPFRATNPLDNLYGLTFFTRLPVSRHQLRTIAQKGTPSIFVWMSTRGGQPFHFIGLHPRPPAPGQDTENRDGEIAIAARLASEENVPVLAMGDFNDVAWSKTSQTFKRIGGYVDPRVGRGLYATFPASWPLFRWPLDHLFLTPDMAVMSVDVLENVGSDHLPVTARLCLEPGLGKAMNDTPEAPDAEDQRDANEMIEKMVDENAGK